ncbi:MAG TPA: EAL domain-containing protein [Kineosporiaceae bacterium]
MAGLLGLVAFTVCAVIAAASWATEAVSRSLVEREHSAALTGWAVLSAVAGVVALAMGDVSRPAVLGLLAVATIAAVVGVAGAARLPTLATGLVPAAAEAALVAGSLVSVFWVVAGAPAHPPAAAVVWLAVATAELLTAALIVRIPVVTPSVALDRRYRPVVATSAAALAGLAVGDALITLYQLGSGPGVLSTGLALRSLAFLVAAAVPWVPEGRVQPIRPASTATRAFPYGLVGVALISLLVAAFAGRTGSVSLLLVSVVVCGLIAVQGFTSRESARLRAELAAARARLAALLESVTDVVLTVDPIGRVATANAAASRVLHRTPEALVGLDVGELAIPDHRAALRRAVDDVVHGRRSSARTEVQLSPPATGTAEVRLQAAPGGAVANLSDITDVVELRERLERLARFDEMTGLANRAHLLSQINAWLRARLPVAVLYCDLDGFKAVNDRFGHVCGDDVLAEAARRIRAVAHDLPGERSLVARVGGDEFVVAVVRIPQEQVPTAAERLLAALRPTFAVGDRAVRVGVSIGVAASADRVPVPGEVEDADDLLHRADVAMFAAKQGGRFRCVRWDPEIQARALRRVDIAIGLRRALDSHRLALAYQPLVRLSDGAVVGVEALLRVEAEDDAPGALAGLPELVSPAELVAVAEDTGEIAEVGHWVVTEATLQAARWRAQGHDILMNVNVSVRQLETEGFVAFVRDALATAGLPASGLVMEITEGQLLTETDPAWGAVEQLRGMGVVLVIDDFGSGYSSLAYLRRMPVRGVKLDRAILDDLTTDPRARTLARAVIAAARALGLLVVAEGLETLEAARIARDLGAWAGQGFALFEAMPADEVSAILADPPTQLGSDPRRAAADARRAAADARRAGRAGHPPAGPETGRAGTHPAGHRTGEGNRSGSGGGDRPVRAEAQPAGLGDDVPAIVPGIDPADSGAHDVASADLT